jgi:hypothetical protein
VHLWQIPSDRFRFLSEVETRSSLSTKLEGRKGDGGLGQGRKEMGDLEGETE